MDYKNVIESRYNREAWEALLHDIFLSGANFRTTPIPVDAHSPLVSESLQLGTITLKDDNKIAVYEIKLSNSVDIVENRVGIRNLLFSDWKFKGCAGAFIFCYRDNESVLRFSYVSQTFAFGEDGKMAKEETDTKRFTYILGEGHRSRTAIGQFENLKSSSQTLKDLTKAFSLDAVSDRFFDDYKEVYEDIVEYVTGKRYVKVANKWEEKVIHAPNEILMAEFSWYEDPEKTVRDYVKRLMSRIVFLQFIQKKGWLGVPVDKEWGEGDKEFLQHLYEKYDNKDNFIDGILELLFDDINHKRENDIANFILGRDIKVPYLNGGLFERDSVDERTFRLPRTLMDKMMCFFSSYNFTIDENDPDDAEIGVDPEMLGRIFENLLEDNKDKGAFYTPKEIVQYMCQESLIAYLQKGKPEAEAEVIRTFVTTYDASILNDKLKRDVDAKLKKVKICDPAIGSGAFPMGLLKELFACRSAIEGLSEDNAAEIKKHIIQNNIYGVDIEKGAVEIARLRFWLAIIVDEKSPHTLPNMDFKIMQGNSLLENYKGIDLSGLSGKREKKKGADNQGVQLTFEFGERSVLLDIQDLINSYYRITEHDKKEECREKINSLVKKYLKVYTSDSPIYSRDIDEMDIPNNKFFLWHTYFADVFANAEERDSKGFDILIANPPYIDSESMVKQGMTPLRDDLKGRFKTLSGNWDMYMAFMSFGLSIADYCTFITPDKWLSKPFGLNFREEHLRNNAYFVTRAGSHVFDNATVDAIITLFKPSCRELNIWEFDNKKKLRKITTTEAHKLHEPYLIDYLFSEDRNIIEKLDKFNGRIADFALSEGACATSDAYKLKPFIYNNPNPDFEEEFIVINTGTISKFSHRWGRSSFTYLKDKYQYPVVKKVDFYENFGKTYIRRAASPKIVFKGLNLLDACLDLEGHILPGKTTMTLCSDDKDKLKFLCGVLNSKLFIFYIKKKYMSSSYCGGITFTSDMIDYIPIPEISEGFKDSIISKVDEIITRQRVDALDACNDCLERIDRLVYDLYGLDKDEIAIINNQ